MDKHPSHPQKFACSYTYSMDVYLADLHNTERSKGQIDQHKISEGRKSPCCCTVIWKKFCAFTAFSAIEKALTGHKKGFCRPHIVLT